MKITINSFTNGNILPIALIASAFIGLMGVIGLMALPLNNQPIANMRIEPQHGIVTIGNTFTVKVVVSSQIPVNVFGGEVVFDPNILTIQSIDYNTSIADLWAEQPWFSNGAGTLNFAGGTTKKGGFIGTDQLITITFMTQRTGDGVLGLSEARILQHDGLGTDVQLDTPPDALFTVQESVENMVTAKNVPSASYSVVEAAPSTDLNNDGRQSIADLSIFMLYLAKQDTRADFNLDGTVNIQDLSIMRAAK